MDFADAQERHVTGSQEVTEWCSCREPFSEPGSNVCSICGLEKEETLHEREDAEYEERRDRETSRE